VERLRRSAEAAGALPLIEELPEGWEQSLGTGDDRGIALILLVSGSARVILAAIDLRTPQYSLLSRRYTHAAEEEPTSAREGTNS
jgi:hypothetical protein